MDCHKFCSGLCQLCFNVSYKATALRFAGVDGSADKHALLEMTLCPKEEHQHHKAACISRTCEVCGIDKLEEYVKDINYSKPVSWKEWSFDKDAQETCQLISSNLKMRSITCLEDRNERHLVGDTFLEVCL